MSGKAFLDPPGHLNVRNSICLHIHSNIQMELVFHTTSGASRSRLPSTYLNVVTVLQTTFLLDLLKYWYIYNIIIICYTVRQKFGKSFPAELNTINSQETIYLVPLTQCWEMLGEKNCPSFRLSKRICRIIQLVLVGQNLLLLADLVKTMSPLSEPLPSHRWCHSLLQSRPTPSQSAGCTFWGLY